MSYQSIKFDVKDGVARVILNEPKSLNALSPNMLVELNDVLDECLKREDLRVFVLTGEGRGFCAGANLAQPAGSGEKDPLLKTRGDYTRRAMNEGFNPIVKKLTALKMPTLAIVNGVAAGGGYGLALSFDLVMAAESAKFILVFTPQLGLIPDVGASWHAPRRLGRAKAMAAAFFGDRMSAADAVKEGLIWRAVPDDELMSEADAVIEQLKNGPTKAYPQVRHAFDLAPMQSLSDQVDLEADWQPDLINTDDFQEGVTAFLEKRKPVFKGC